LTGDCFDFDPKPEKESVWIFKKIKNDQRLFFLDRLPKKNMFFMKRTTSQAVRPPGGKEGKEDKQR
jgi:hypothetical protein